MLKKLEMIKGIQETKQKQEQERRNKNY